MIAPTPSSRAAEVILDQNNDDAVFVLGSVSYGDNRHGLSYFAYWTNGRSLNLLSASCMGALCSVLIDLWRWNGKSFANAAMTDAARSARSAIARMEINPAQSRKRRVCQNENELWERAACVFRVCISRGVLFITTKGNTHTGNRVT